MTRIINFNRDLINYGVLILFFGILIIFMRSSLLSENNILSLGITFDLLVTIPIMYLFLTNKTKTSKTSIISIISIGYLIGSYFLPQENQDYLNLFKTWALPILKVFILTFGIIKFRSVLILYNKLKNTSTDFFDIIKRLSLIHI